MSASAPRRPRSDEDVETDEEIGERGNVPDLIGLDPLPDDEDDEG